MATTFVATRAASTFPTMQASGQGIANVAYGSYTLTAASVANDIYQLCRLPAGATVLGGWLTAADLDTGTEALDIDWGWAANGVDAADPDGFGNLGVWSGDAITDLRPTVAIYYPMQGVAMTGDFITFGAETIVQCVCNVAPNAGGTGVLKCIVFYAHSGARP